MRIASSLHNGLCGKPYDNSEERQSYNSACKHVAVVDTQMERKSDDAARPGIAASAQKSDVRQRKFKNLTLYMEYGTPCMELPRAQCPIDCLEGPRQSSLQRWVTLRLPAPSRKNFGEWTARSGTDSCVVSTDSDDSTASDRHRKLTDSCKYSMH